MSARLQAPQLNVVMSKESRRTLIRFLEKPRYEVIPVEGVEETLAEHVPRDVKLTVTASPVRGIERTLDLTEALVRCGFHVVPHLSARSVEDGAHLRDILQRVERLRLREVFVIAGDATEPAGTFEGALELLTAMAEVDHGIDEIGVTGYPESHPFLNDDITIQAMWDKRRFATYIVSNVCFDARVIAKWVRRVRGRRIELPIHIGLPGVTDRNKLVRISAKIGVGESARFLSRHTSWLPRLFLPGGYSPTRLVRRLTPRVARPDSNVAGLHFYTFNEIRKTERWRQDTLAHLKESPTSLVR